DVSTSETNNVGNQDIPVWQELKAPRLWSLDTQDVRNQKVVYINNVDFQSLMYGGPSVTLIDHKVQDIGRNGCHVEDHQSVMGRIAIVQDPSNACDLWTVTEYAQKAGALAVLFYSTSGQLLSGSVLPHSWKQDDPLSSIPVLSITRDLGAKLIEGKSTFFVSIVTDILSGASKESE
ncbi:hypothetical protein BX616_008895, partial [Lobosporangium transversale]